MVAKAPLASGEHDAARPRAPGALVTRAPGHGIVSFGRLRPGDELAVLVRLASPLPPVPPPRTGRIAEGGDSPLGPPRDRVAVVERPLVPRVTRLENPP